MSMCFKRRFPIRTDKRATEMGQTPSFTVAAQSAGTPSPTRSQMSDGCDGREWQAQVATEQPVCGEVPATSIFGRTRGGLRPNGEYGSPEVSCR